MPLGLIIHYHGFGIMLSSSIFWSSCCLLWLKNPTVFLFLDCLSGLFGAGLVSCFNVRETSGTEADKAPQTRDFTGAGNSSLPISINIPFNLSRPNLSDADRGPTAPYRPGPVYRHSLKDLTIGNSYNRF
jgi:hypothetical protein